MKLNFNKDGKGKDKNRVTSMQLGGYADMLKHREKMLPECQETIQEVFDDYSGGLVCIVKMQEDENGMPEGAQILMVGTARAEVQLNLSRALSDASNQAVEHLMKSVGDDPKALAELAKVLMGEVASKLHDIQWDTDK